MPDALARARALARAWAAERRDLEHTLAGARSDHDRLALTIADIVQTWRGIEDYLQSGAGLDQVGTLVRVALAAALERLSAAGITLDGQPGEGLDLQKHRVVSETTPAGGRPGHVVAVVTPGVLCHGRRLRIADVVVGGGEQQNGSANRD